MRVNVFDPQEDEQNIKAKIKYHDIIQEYIETFNLNQNLAKDIRFF